MKFAARLRTSVVVGFAFALMLALTAHSRADDLDMNNKLSLADLAEYRSALAGNPTADGAKTADPPARVQFRDLWNQPETFRGRRVIVQGRVERVFRQGAVGSFPPLGEVWIISPTGDPFCVVFPQQELTTENDQRDNTNRRSQTAHNPVRQDKTQLTPAVGRMIRFTGTFLKMVSYAASDGERLAPLIVGERPPLDKPDSSERADATRLRESSAEVFRSAGGNNSRARHGRGPWLPANGIIALALAAVAAGIISWQHLRAPARHHRSGRTSLASSEHEEPLVFHTDNGQRTTDK
jgi:hypothetical protein